MSWIKRNRAFEAKKKGGLDGGNLRISLPMTIPGELANLRRLGPEKKGKKKLPVVNKASI
jgi:hypothetical protein